MYCGLSQGDACLLLIVCLSQNFHKRDSKPKKRLRENRPITHIKDNNTHGIGLFPWSLFLGLESLLRKLLDSVYF